VGDEFERADVIDPGSIDSTPTRTMRLRVGAAKGIHGVRLEEATPTADINEQGPFARELHDYSPDFILFPDAEGQSDPSAPPMEGGRNDYHPRPVQAFLDAANPYIATPRTFVVGIYVVAFCGLAMMLGLVAIVLPIRPHAFTELPLLVTGGLAAATLALTAFLLGTKPPTMDRLRERIAMHKPTATLGVRRQNLVWKRDDAWARDAWKDYKTRVFPSAEYPRTCYGRAAQLGGELYLQYWQFYVFNDWYNRHEADWELVVVRLSPTETGWRRVAAAYSAHYGGHWRQWRDVECRDGTHPVVYVARGSHAQYFESRKGGYYATLTQPLGVLEFRLRLTFQKDDWKDQVPATPVRGSSTYDLCVLPTPSSPKVWTREQRLTFWWLEFAGLWGGREAIDGPRRQTLKWRNPWRWIDSSVEPDPAAWEPRITRTRR
jgi:hypothetical protein